MTTTDFKGLIADAIQCGDIVRQQAKGEYAYFKFVGGTFGGCQLRLYPPFEPFTHGEEVWRLERQFDKKGKQLRSVYVLDRDVQSDPESGLFTK